ncbi:HIT family protein [Actinomadura sp. DC4]|uniref:HIT family protein n=1 Tax=Actinomadura sp. DC4 TaxID=3055069 RepID=UPI0025AFF81C|nr:HIT family protein [Actinomadura sp. DC4]MDN3351592.1 HIT family protein [Actinomadura sp. DC4]
MAAIRDGDCTFCAAMTNGRGQRTEQGLVAVIADAHPVTEGHHLIVPARHVADFFEMTALEVREAYAALHDLRGRLRAADPEIAGFNVGTNSGIAAGQTVFHAHIHLIPRRVGDTPDPRGGVRGVVPARSGP